MNFIQHKNLFLLSLLFTLPATTHCMKRKHEEIAISDNTKADNLYITTLQNKRDQFKTTLITMDSKHNYWNFGTRIIIDELFLSSTYHQDLHKKTYGDIEKRTTYCKEFDLQIYGQFNIDKLQNNTKETLDVLKNIRIQNYSGLGSATMAEQVSIAEKREFIQKLLDLNFIPTPKDKELAFVELWEREYQIIQKICYLKISPFLTQIPNDVIRFILQIFIKKELLF